MDFPSAPALPSGHNTSTLRAFITQSLSCDSSPRDTGGECGHWTWFTGGGCLLGGVSEWRCRAQSGEDPVAAASLVNQVQCSLSSKPGPVPAFSTSVTG